MTRFLLFLLHTVCIVAIAFGQSAAKDIWLDDLSLEQMLNIRVEVAAGQALTQQESPGIVSLITREEILNSGARDLLDVLRLVPGIEFAQDVQGVIGITMRGNWANEGKILLMIDGLEQNDLSYGTLQFGNRYNLQSIERVEIIRGPGSALYGGFAELGVINIITRDGEALKRISAAATYTTETLGYTRRNLSLSAGNQQKNDLTWAIHALGGQGNLSNGQYITLNGATYSLRDSAAENPLQLIGKMKYKQWAATAMIERYRRTWTHYDGEIYAKPYPITFSNAQIDIRRNVEMTKRIKIMQRIAIRNFNPYRMTSVPYVRGGTDSLPDFLGDEPTLRALASMQADITLKERGNLTVGLEHSQDFARLDVTAGAGRTFWNGKKAVHFWNTAGYAQLLLHTPFATITAGARADWHNIYGLIGAPRLALTRSYKHFYWKALASQAYRVPAIQNINLNAAANNNTPNIKPEYTNVLEVEAGYQFGATFSVQANLFYSNIRNTIIYTTVGTMELYTNAQQTGTMGGEMELRYKQPWGYLSGTYSYYTADKINKIANYATVANTGSMLGTAQHKATLKGHIILTKQLSINPSYVLLGNRYAQSRVETADNLLPMVHLLHLYIQYNGLLNNKLNVGVGGYNLLNSSYSLIQPYRGNDAPLPTAGRELVLRISYDIFSYK